MNNKRMIVISIILIVLLIGGSFAYWMLNLSQSTTNNIATSCFNISLSENNAINLQNAFPMRDSEGASLTPYEFTITNNCSTYAYYEVNLEVLNTTNLNSEYIKIMLDDENPSLLSNKTETTTTLSNASSSYRLKTAYLHASESKTYNLILWLDENVTLADNVTEKEFSGKVTIRATYKPDVPTQMEECELVYGERAGVCNFIAQADPENSKCFTLNVDGMIQDTTHRLSNSDTPIVCSAEDDYGTSFYLMGLHNDNNVKFADSCWKVIRTTGTGGIKMIYNGDVDEYGTCTTTSGTHKGFSIQTINISGNKLYSSTYVKEGDTYTLTNPITLNGGNDLSDIIGKYTCNSTNNTCNTLYSVIDGELLTSAYAIVLDQNTNYAQIGTSRFNKRENSPSYVGYMYNDEYISNEKNMTTEVKVIEIEYANKKNYYYGDTISYSNGYYYLTNQDGSNLTQLSWDSNYENNMVGKYTCKYDYNYNRCPTMYKVLDTTTVANQMATEILTGGRLSIGEIKLATSYSENNGIYELINPETLTSKDWYSNYSNYSNYYICGNWNQTTCSDLRKIITSTARTILGKTLELSHKYYYGNSFTYNMNNSRPYALIDTVQFWDVTDATNKASIDTHRYTCFYSTDNTCDELYFIYYSSESPSYVKLQENETISDALNKMVVNNDINVKDSFIKKVIDWWYEKNILGTINEGKLEDTVFCNDRTIDDLGGWSEIGTVGALKFNASGYKYYLKCPNKRDAFTVNDLEKGNGALTYPIGLLTTPETILVGNLNANKTGTMYWGITPINFSTESKSCVRGVSESGYFGQRIYGTNEWGGVRPAISLKPGTKFIAGGDGTASNPFVVDMNG